MSVFDRAARYYDAIYATKDYAAETDYVRRLVARHSPEAKTWLDLGCGTGGHARRLAEAGFKVTGADRSAGMIERAITERALAPVEVADRLDYIVGDLRELRLGRTFNVVSALFHVISYQTSNADLAAALRTAAVHLSPGGCLVFDFWYGPGVLTDPPTERVREFPLGDQIFVRRAIPTLFSNENCVDVAYHFEVRDSTGQVIDVFNENHKMRYLFRPEIEWMLEAVRLRLEAFYGWMTEDPTKLGDWNAVVLVRK
jgi:SAM-dependent methyltransferase